MIGVCHVDLFHALHVSGLVTRQTRRVRKRLNHRPSHLVPEKFDSIDVGRGFPRRQRHDRLLVERIAFAHDVAGGGHGGNDLVGNRASSAITEPARQPARDGAVSAVQQLAQQIGGIADHCQGGAGVGGMIYEIPGRSFDQRSLQSVQA